MEGTIFLKYSVDAGTTWSTQESIKVSRCHAWIRPVPLDDFPKQTMNEYALCYKAVARLVISIQCDLKQFDPGTTNGDLLYLFINKLRAAPLIHLYMPGPGIDGFTVFATSDNSNFLVPEHTP